MWNWFRIVACAAVVVIAASAAGATPRPPVQYYFFRSSVSVYSWHSHGNNEKSDRIGDYTYRANYQFRGIVVFDTNVRDQRYEPRFYSEPLVAGSVLIQDNRKKPKSYRIQPREWEPVCATFRDKPSQFRKTGDPSEPGANYQYVPAPRGSISINHSARTLSINPHLATWSSWGCGTHDSIRAHRLQSGPAMTVVAPTRTKITAGESVNIYCVDKASHDSNHPHGVEFKGEVAIAISFDGATSLEPLEESLKSLKGATTSPGLKPTGNDGESCSKGHKDW